MEERTKALLVGVNLNNDPEFETALKELESLAEACNMEVVGVETQNVSQINTGVYVGQLNPRVREELWKRICKHLPRGRATMVYSANNEQRMSFHVHNTTWQPADYEASR